MTCEKILSFLVYKKKKKIDGCYTYKYIFIIILFGEDIDALAAVLILLQGISIHVFILFISKLPSII